MSQDWRKTREYRIWRVKVIRRDKRCIVCGSIKNRHAHHLDHASYFKKRRFKENNGVCLCAKCHRHYHCDFHRSFKEKCTVDDFKNFIKLFRYIYSVAVVKHLEQILKFAKDFKEEAEQEYDNPN